jgi:hypothetical protein
VEGPIKSCEKFIGFLPFVCFYLSLSFILSLLFLLAACQMSSDGSQMTLNTRKGKKNNKSREKKVA